MKQVLELPAFRRLLAVSMINELAVSIGAVALALLVYRRTGSAIGATAFFLCADFGPAILSPFFVARLDQRSARRVLAGAYASEALIFLALAWLVHHFALSAVLALALVSGTIDLTARVIGRATWTSITSREGHVRDANALVSMGFSICFMAGPALGGALVAIYGSVAALLASAAGYGVSVLVIGTTERLAAGAADPDPGAGRIRAAVKYVRDQPLTRRLLGLEAVGLVFFAIATPVEVVFAQHTLHAGAGGYGLLLAVWGAGSIVGSAIYARWREYSSRLQIAASAGLVGVGLVVMAIAPSLAVAVAGAAVAGTGNGIQLVAIFSALQESLADRWMALVLSLHGSILQAMPGAGFVIGGAIAALASPRVALAVAGVGAVGVAALMWVRLGEMDSPGYRTPAEVPTPSQDPALTAAARQR